MSFEELLLTQYEKEVTRLREQVKEKEEHNKALLKQIKDYKSQTSKYSQEEANLLFKIQTVKTRLNDMHLKKSGVNNFQKYHYYELEDINKPIADTLLEEGLSSLFTFKEDMAYLQITDKETGVWIQWQTPLKTSERWRKSLQNTTKKGDVGDYMKPMQALQTYARRALYLQALEIAEPNTIEQEGGNGKKEKVTIDRSAELILPDNLSDVNKEIFDKIKQDFGDKVPFNKRTVTNKLTSMKKSGKIDEDIYNNCLENIKG